MTDIADAPKARTDRRDAVRPVGSSAIAGFAPEDCTLVLP